MKRRWWLALLTTAVAGIGLAAGLTSSAGAAVSALPSSSCGPIQYGGSGSPDYLIASDLPLQSASRTQTVQMGEAVNYVLKQQGYKAGKYTVGYQACDDSTAQAGSWDSAKCQANANAYASNPAVLGVIGTFNSGCAKVIIPILDRANPGPVAMVSPANTAVGLTKSGPSTSKGEPQIYYPTGTRNYARVVANDAYQGAAQGLMMKQLHLKKIYILNDGQLYGLGVATNVRNALKQLGISVVGFQKWDPKASSYEDIATRIQQSKADGVFLGGIIDNNQSKLEKDIRTKLGPKVQILAPDGLTPIVGKGSFVAQAGKAANNTLISVAGLPASKLTGAGKTFVQGFSSEAGGQIQPYSAYAAQAAVVLLNAIANSDGSRAQVTANLFKTNITGGILGNFKIDASGDTTSGPVTFYKVVNGKQTTYKTITPSTSLVKKV